MEIKENLESFGSLANPNSENRKIEISDYDASSSDNRPNKRARRNISSSDDDKEEEVNSTRSSPSTSSDKTEKINERINLDLNMLASTEEEDDDRMFLESTWSNNVKQRDCGDGEGEEVEEIKLDLNSTPAPSEGAEGYNLEGEVWPEDWDQQVGGCDDDHDDIDGNDQDYYDDDGGYDDDDDDDVGNKRIKLDLNFTPLSEEEGEEQEVRQEEKEEDQRQYQLDEEEERPVEVRYQSEEEEKEKEKEEVRLEEEQVWYQEEEENQQEVRPAEGQAQYQEDDEEEEDQYWYQSEGEDQRCYQAEEKEVRSEESWHPSEEEEELVRLPNAARSNLDFSRTPTKRELEDLKNSTIPPAKKRDDEPEHSSDSNHSSFVCEICVQQKVSSEWFAIENCGHAYCKDCLIKHVATKLQQNIVSIPCPTPDCVSGSLSPEHCRPILPRDLFDSWASAL